MVPTAKQQQAYNASQYTSTGLVASASSLLLPEMPFTASAKAHQPAQVPPSCAQAAEEQQQAMFSADTNMAEPDAMCTDLKASSQQVEQEQIMSDAPARLSQPAALDPAAVAELEHASINIHQQSSEATVSQDASLLPNSVQHEQSELLSLPVLVPSTPHGDLKESANQALSLEHGLAGKTADPLQGAMSQSSSQHADAANSMPSNILAEANEAVTCHAAQPNQHVDTEHPVSQPSNTSIDIAIESVMLPDASLLQDAGEPHEQSPPLAAARGLALQSVTGISQPAADAALTSDTVRTGLHRASGAMQKARKPFSWRKHGRSWQYKK